MPLVTRTYALPPEALVEFEREIPAEQRSSVIGTLLEEWLARRDRETLRQQIIEGCQEMAEEYLRIEKEFHPLEEEIERELYEGTATP